MTATVEQSDDANACIHCALDYDFDLPESLIKDAHSKNVVIFGGAGISTEVATVFPETILDTAAGRLELDSPGSFPEVLQAFEDKFGRAALVQMIKKKFDYINDYQGLRYHARRFHRELATMPYLQEIVTTNWDTYFEEECAATPFVDGADIALYQLPGRKLLKVHGSITHLSSLIATEADYARSLDDLGSNVIGGLLRQILATKTVVFVGYSLRDWNFQRLYSALRADMSNFAPKAYFVSPFPADETIRERYSLEVLQTSGVNFLRALKVELIGHCFIADDVYQHVDELYDAILAADKVAKSVSHKEYPAVVFCWAYHDGARDACHRILLHRSSGEYSDLHHVQALCRSYDRAYDEAMEEERYWDAAYIDGYLSGIYMLYSTDEEHGQNFIETVPYYFVFGADSDMRTEEEFRTALAQSRRRSPKQRRAARAISEKLPDGMVYTHSPFLPSLPTGEND